MADVENTVAAEEAMTVEEQQDTGAEVAAETLMQNLSENTDAHAAEEPQAEEQQTEQEAQGNPYAEGLQTLYDDGWTQESITALITDPQALRDIQGGKSVRQAAFAFMQRGMAAAKPAAKKSVPTFRTPATAGAKETNRIAEMSKEEFAEFSRKAKDALMEGKLVSFR